MLLINPDINETVDIDQTKALRTKNGKRWFMEQTTIKVSKDAVDFLKTEGKYGDTMATIFDRLVGELKALREEKAKLPEQGNADGIPAMA